MLFDLRKHEKLYHALYSDVIAVEDRVFKIFKKCGDRSFDDHSRSKFTGQCNAYLRAVEDPILRKHVAEFYGQCVIEGVIDEDGVDVSNKYHLDACYEIERLSGDPLKTNDNEIRSNRTYILESLQRFKSSGIDTSDASVFYYDDPERFKLIDFEEF